VDAGDWAWIGGLFDARLPAWYPTACPVVGIASSGLWEKSCTISTLGMWPSSTRCACSAPFGLPVVPEV